MKNKHPHYDVIIAWAEGKTVQVWSDWSQAWHDWPFARNAPSFDHDGKFRVKPETIRYRNFLLRNSSGERPFVGSVTEEDNKEEPREQWGRFVRWLGDWQEVEI